MTNIENNRTVGSTSVVSNYAYTYNALGQRTERAQFGSAITSSTDTFSYDALGQVIGSSNSVETTAASWNPSYTFDMIGNRSGATVDFNGSQNYTANALNQYTAIDSVSPVHDLDGNLISSGPWTYSWNGENRLIKADNGTISIDFEYDYQGRLVKKDDGTNVELYVYDGWNRIATFDVGSSSFTLHSSYLWGLDLSGTMQGAGGVGGLLKEGNLYPLYDANGNIMQKLNSSGGTAMSVAYDPFGNVIEGSLVGEYGFSTKPLVDDLDWYYYGFRYYDPQTGRWPSRDPIEERGGMNLYGFVSNDGVNKFDLLGQTECCGDEELESGKECCGGTQKRTGGRRNSNRGGWSCCGDEEDGDWYRAEGQAYGTPQCCNDGNVLDMVRYWKYHNHLDAKDCAKKTSGSSAVSAAAGGGGYAAGHAATPKPRNPHPLGLAVAAATYAVGEYLQNAAALNKCEKWICEEQN